MFDPWFKLPSKRSRYDYSPKWLVLLDWITFLGTWGVILLILSVPIFGYVKFWLISFGLFEPDPSDPILLLFEEDR